MEVTGVISELFRKYLSNISGKHDFKELQKTATWGTVHTLRTVRMYEYKYKIFSMRNNITSNTNFNKGWSQNCTQET